MVTAPTVESARITNTRLRFGRHQDLPAITRLIQRANATQRVPCVDQGELEAVADRGQLLVLQLSEDEISAAACVAPGRGLVFLVLDPEIASVDLEHRMIEVADALCESEQPASSRLGTHATRVRGRR